MTTNLVLALDTITVEDLDRNDGAMYQAFDKYVDVYKISLPFIFRALRAAPDLLDIFLEDNRVFFDFKLHDIPMQMEESIMALCEYRPELITMHTVAGKEGMYSAAQRLKGINDYTKLVGVTVLTSMDEENWGHIGKYSLGTAPFKFAQLAAEQGLHGVVCANDDAEFIKIAHPELLTVVPGYRMGSAEGDQKRTATPYSLNVKNVDYLVVGRTVTSLKDVDRMASKLETIKTSLIGT